MSIRELADIIIVNDNLYIEHNVLSCGVGPSISLTDFEDGETVFISTKQEAEEVMKACQMFLDSINSWDWVAKDKPDDK